MGYTLSMEDFDLAADIRKEEEQRREASEGNMRNIAVKLAVGAQVRKIEILTEPCESCSA